MSTTTPTGTPRHADQLEDGAIWYDTSTERSADWSRGTLYDERTVDGEREPLKVVLLGPSGVGKTTLTEALRRHWTGERPLAMSAAAARTPRQTIGVDFFTVRLPGNRLAVQLWDTAGQERFAPVTSALTRDVAAFVLVYEPQRPSTWRELFERWVPLVARAQADDLAAGRPAPLVCVVATKIDLLGEPLPEFAEERAAARNVNARSFSAVSVMNGDSLADTATTIARLLSDYRPSYEAAARRARRRRRARVVRDATLPVGRMLLDSEDERDEEIVRAPKSSSCAC